MPIRPRIQKIIGNKLVTDRQTGVPSPVTPSEIPCRVNNWAGSSKQKLLLRVGLIGKFNFWGAQPNPGPIGSTFPNGGVCNEANKQKLLLGVGLLCKI
jgi:hypothetical protein